MLHAPDEWRRRTIRVGKNHVNLGEEHCPFTSHVPPGDRPFWRAIPPARPTASREARARDTAGNGARHVRRTPIGPTGMPKHDRRTRRGNRTGPKTHVDRNDACTRNERVRRVLAHTHNLQPGGSAACVCAHTLGKRTERGAGRVIKKKKKEKTRLRAGAAPRLRPCGAGRAWRSAGR